MELRFQRENRNNDCWELLIHLKMRFRNLRTLFDLKQEIWYKKMIFDNAYGHFTKNSMKNFSTLFNFKFNFRPAPNFTKLFLTWILWNRTCSFICAMICSWGRLRWCSFCQITKKIRRNRKFRVKNENLWDFFKMFLDHWIKLYNLQTTVFGHIIVFWKPYFRHCDP